MQKIELVRHTDGAAVRISDVDIPTYGMTDVTCYVRPDSLTEVVITYVVSDFIVKDE